MSHIIDFNVFERLLRNHDINNIKKMITPDNISYRIRHYPGDVGWGVVRHLSIHGDDDDENVVLLNHFVELGASLEMHTKKCRTPLHTAATLGKFKMTQELLRLGADVNKCDEDNHTPLYFTLITISAYHEDKKSNVKKCATILIDAGAHLKLVNGNHQYWIPQWAIDFDIQRREIRHLCIVVLGLKTCHSLLIGCENGKDVLRIISKCIWGMRGHI